MMRIKRGVQEISIFLAGSVVFPMATLLVFFFRGMRPCFEAHMHAARVLTACTTGSRCLQTSSTRCSLKLTVQQLTVYFSQRLQLAIRAANLSAVRASLQEIATQTIILDGCFSPPRLFFQVRAIICGDYLPEAKSNHEKPVYRREAAVPPRPDQLQFSEQFSHRRCGPKQNPKMGQLRFCLWSIR